MKIRLIEEEKKRILLLYEKIGGTPTSEMLNSDKGKNTIKMKEFFNKYYNLNLPLDGNWMTKEYNDTMKRYLEEKGISVWVCKPNDGWCRADGADEGEVTTQEVKKLVSTIEMDKKKMGTQIGGKINNTHDSSYEYMLKDGKYYFKGKGVLAKKYPNWVEATGKGLEGIKKNVKF